MKTYTYIGIIAFLILITSCGFAFASDDNVELNIFGILPFGDAVEVKSIDCKSTYSNNLLDDDAHGIKVTIELIPNENIEHIRSLELQNVKIKYENGTEVQLENDGFNYDTSDLDNYYFDTLNSLDEDYDYLFTYYSPVSYYNDNYEDSNPDAPYEITHIKGDIVVNTTTEDNRVIGHLDSDIDIS